MLYSYKNRIRRICLYIMFLLVLSSCSSEIKNFNLLDFTTLNVTTFFDTEFINLEQVDNPINNNRIFEEDSFTISFWIFPESNYNWSTLLSTGDINNFLILSTKGNPDGADSGLNLSIRNNGGEIIRILSNKKNTVDLRKFNHIAITKNKYSISLYQWRISCRK